MSDTQSTEKVKQKQKETKQKASSKQQVDTVTNPQKKINSKNSRLL